MTIDEIIARLEAIKDARPAQAICDDCEEEIDIDDDETGDAIDRLILDIEIDERQKREQAIGVDGGAPVVSTGCSTK